MSKPARRGGSTRPRHTLTETDEIARALDDAALAWPEFRGDRSALLRKLVEAGHASVHVDGGVRELLAGAAEATPLAGVCTTYRLRMPDAVALHTAIHTGSALATFDASLAAAAERAVVALAS